MKHILLIYLLLFGKIVSAQTTHTLPYPVTAEQLNTEQDVQTLIDSLLADTLTDLKVSNISTVQVINQRDTALLELADSLGLMKSFYKGDFDENGVTDLLFSANQGGVLMHFVILFYDNNQYQWHSLNRGDAVEDVIFRIVHLENQTALEYFYDPQPEYVPRSNIEFSKKLLVFYEGGFIEYNPDIKIHQIEHITFRTHGCFGFCPYFLLKIDEKHTAFLDAGSFNFSKNGQVLKGKYTTVIKEADYQRLMNLLNYMEFENLKSKYTVPWTDDQSSTLTITYDGGKIIKIEDYGLLGTFGLKRVYQMLFDWRFNQNWEKYGGKGKRKRKGFNLSQQ